MELPPTIVMFVLGDSRFSTWFQIDLIPQVATTTPTVWLSPDHAQQLLELRTNLDHRYHSSARFVEFA